MAIGPFPTELRSYLPSNLLQPDGTTLKPGIDPAEAQALAKSVQARASALPPAEARLFLAMVAQADLAPNGRIPADIGKALAVFEHAAATLSAPGGSTFDFLARVMIEQASEQRKNALDNRLNAREQAKSELMDQAQKMEEAATASKDAAFSAMITTVVMSSVALVASTAGSIVGGASAVKQGSAFKSALAGETGALAGKTGAIAGKTGAVAGETGAVATKALGVKEAATLSTQGLSSGWIRAGKAAEGLAGAQQIGQIGQASGGYISATGEADAKNKEAEGQRSAAEAQNAQAKADIAKESQEALNQMIQSIIQFIKDLKEAKAEQMRAMTRV